MPSPFSFGPQDFFRAQENSFANPLNSANVNSGWGIDPNLLTPSFQANYRPQYNGAQPYNQYGRVGFFGGLSHLANPAGQEPRWGNPIDNNFASIAAVTQRPSDASVWTMQRILAPAAVFGASYKALGSPTFLGNFTGRGVGASFGRSFGQGLASGTTRGLGLSRMATMGGIRGAIAGGTERAVIGAAGTLGSVAGGFGIPLLAGQMAMWGLDKTLFQPYANTRLNAANLQRNFSGISFGDATGNAVSGKGLGFQESALMGNELTRMGTQDMLFSSKEFSNIADFSARAGLLDNVGAKKITQRVKDISEQIKLIMTIYKDPDIRKAIEELSKLNIAGADVTGGVQSVAAGTLRRLGTQASVAGISVQRLMNTVGAQGQYMFQSNGMTPFLGQLAAANMLGGFVSAQRTGLMSQAQIARLGGVEGATQSALTAAIASGMTPLNQFGLYNQQFGGGRGSAIPGVNQSIVGTVGSFGGSVARDPFGTMGRMTLFGSQLAGRQTTREGLAATENQAVTIARAIGTIRPGRDGKYNFEDLVPILSQMGLSPDSIRAMGELRASQTNPEAVRQRQVGINSNRAEQIRAAISQHYAYGGALGRTVRAVKDFGRDVTTSAEDIFIRPFTSGAGGIGDSLTRGIDDFQFGSTFTRGLVVGDSASLFKPVQSSARIFTAGGTGSVTSDAAARIAHRSNSSITKPDVDVGRVVDTVNRLVKAGDKDAIAFSNARTPRDRSRALTKIVRNNSAAFGKLGTSILDSDNPEFREDLYKKVLALPMADVAVDPTKISGDRLTTALSDTLGRKVGQGGMDYATSMAVVSQAYDVESRLQAGEDYADIIGDKKYEALRGVIGSGTDAKSQEAAQNLFKRAAKAGTIGVSTTASDTGDSDLATAIKTKGKNLSTPALRKAFNAAQTITEKSKILARDAVTRGGGRVLDEGLKNATNESPSEVFALVQPMKEADAATRRNREDLMNGNVSYDTFKRDQNTIDFGKAVDTFSKSVRDFGDSVKKSGGTPGKSPDGTTKNPSLIDLRNFHPIDATLNWLNGGQKATTTTSPSNPVPAGAPAR